jgi:hypothetical protein
MVQTGTKAQSASYPMCTGDSFPGGETGGACSWPLTSNRPFMVFHLLSPPV